MLIATIIALLVGVAVLTFIVIKFMLMVMLAIIGAVYFMTFLSLSSLLGTDQIALSILGTMVIGTGILWVLARITGISESSTIYDRPPPRTSSTPDALCPCGSGKRFKNCHGL